MAASLAARTPPLSVLLVLYTSPLNLYEADQHLSTTTKTPHRGLPPPPKTAQHKLRNQHVHSLALQLRVLLPENTRLQAASDQC